MDTGIAALLASESQYEAVMDARKDRLYGLKEWWKDTGEVYKDPLLSRRVQGRVTQLFSLGFCLFDIAAGAGADAIKGGIYHVFGADFRTRAEKLEDRCVENWEKTQRKLLLLRLLRQKPLDEVRSLAEQAARGVPATGLPLAPGKIDADDIRDLMEDRAFHEATDGGLFRILGAALGGFTDRCRLELVVARERIRLLHRDERSAMRTELGQDPETGEKTWGTVLSPTAWADVVSKGVLKSEDYAARAADVAFKETQVAACERLLEPLAAVDFAFERLPPAELLEHVRLLGRSAPYLLFCARVREEDAARALHEFDRQLDDLSRKPEAAEWAALQREVLLDSARAEASDLRARALELTYRDYIYAWDLGGALALCQARGEEAPWKDRADLLRDAIFTDRLKQRGISTARNAGDIAFTMGLVGLASRVTFAVGRAGVGVSLAEAASAGQLSFARYAYGVLNPLVHGPAEILEEAVSEVAVDIAVRLAGPKYEELIAKVVEQLVERLHNEEARSVVDADLESLAQKVAARVQREQSRHPLLDPGQTGRALDAREARRVSRLLHEAQERAARSQDAHVKRSVLRQTADAALECARVLQVAVLDRLARTTREVLGRAEPDAAAAKQYADVRAKNLSAARPPSIGWLEAAFKERRADFFAPGDRFSIEVLRHNFKQLMYAAKPADQARVRALLEQIDQERHERFFRAMTRFLAGNAGGIRGVILNGTSPGNAEYKGLFSDRDFTIVVNNPADAARVRQAVKEAFQAEGILLNEKGAWASADMEVMVQAFVPGQSAPIRTAAAFLNARRRHPLPDGRRRDVGRPVQLPERRHPVAAGRPRPAGRQSQPPARAAREDAPDVRAWAGHRRGPHGQAPQSRRARDRRHRGDGGQPRQERAARRRRPRVGGGAGPGGPAHP